MTNTPPPGAPTAPEAGPRAPSAAEPSAEPSAEGAVGALPPLCVWSDRFARGWNGPHDTDAPAFEVGDALDALARPYPTDAHAVGYAVPAEGGGYEAQQPRLTVSSLAALPREPVMLWAFVDVDNAGHGKWTPDEGAAEVRALVAAAGPGSPLACAGWYVTAGGWRAVWRLADPLGVRSYRAWAEAFLAHLSATSGLPFADPTTGAGGIDPTCVQWSRCYRLPRVTRDGAPYRAAVNLGGAIARPLRWRPRGPLARDPLPAPATGERVTAGAPPFPAVTDVPAATWAALAGAGGPGQPGAACYLAAFRGEALAPRGDRNQAMVRAVGEVLATTKATDPAVPWAVLARAVAAWGGDEGAPTLADLWGACTRFAAKKADEAALAAVVASQPLVLYGPDGFRVWGEATGSYGEPVAAVGLVQQIEALAGSMGAITRTATGAPRDPASLVAAYGAPVRSVAVALGGTSTRYDRATGRVTEGACPLVDVAPRYDEGVGRWLAALFASEPRAFDWLATITRLESPTCAIYLEGPPGVGKGLLASGLAALWGAGSPCSFIEAIGPFNAGLLACPLVVVDEALPDGDHAAAFRALVGDRERDLRRKFRGPAKLVGAVRALVTANNPDALRFRGRLTVDDLDAIGERVLYVRADSAARGVLADLGGAGALRDWAQRPDGRPGRIAEHVAALARDWRGRPGGRFLVEGRVTAWHRDLVTGNPAAAAALAALAHVVTKARGALPAGFALEGAPEAPLEGALLVNVQALRRGWASATGQGYPPDDNALAATLATLARGQGRVPGPGGTRARAWRIPLASIARVAETVQIGDDFASTVAALLRGPGATGKKGSETR